MSRKILLSIIVFMMLVSQQVFAQYSEDVQWAETVLGVSSEYKVSHTSQQYRASQVLGKPNKLPDHGPSFVAWSPAEKDNPNGEWIRVGYANPVQIQQIAIAENYNPGSIQKVYVYDTRGKMRQVYNNDKPRPLKKKARMLRILFKKPTSYKVKSIKVVLNTEAVSGWNHIDAIGISKRRKQIQPLINLQEGVIAEDQMVIEKITENINSSYDEAFPVISPDGKTLYFTRKRHPENLGEKHKDDIWAAYQINGEWSHAEHLGEPLNNVNHNYVCSVSPDGGTLLLGNIYHDKNKASGGVSISHKKNGKWIYPQALEIDDYYNYSRYSEFTLSTSLNILLMAVEREDAIGDRDIYVSFKKPDGSWTKPKNLGKNINTASSELTPFLAADEKTLYFSSMGYSGYGMTDMFVSRRLDDSWTNWSEPVNLGPKFNSPNWDAGYTIEAAGEYAYFISHKNHYEGSADIYRAKLPKGKQPMPVAILSGQVLDAVTGKPIEADVHYEKLENGASFGAANSMTTDGNYQVILPLGESYGIWATADGYVSQHEHFDLSETTNFQQMDKPLYLMPLQKGERFKLNNVFFKRSEAVLLKTSYAELNRLVMLFKEFPSLEIELEGHTDPEGNPFRNMELSKKRVEAVKAYLVQQGISETRIKVLALGSTKPLSRDRTEESKQRNRRVEFRIIKI